MTTSTVAYDAAGNQTLYSPHTLAYDAENRLFSMTHASSGSGTYLYDGQGRRVKKTWTPGGGTAEDTYYVYDIAGNLAAEYGTASNPASATPATLYPFTDMLGSVRAVTDAAGTVVECYDYLPFGRMLSSSDNSRSTSCHPLNPDTAFDSDVSQKFTGQIRDEETRLDYFNARYMSAPQGRFLSPDPLGGELSDPQTLNKYGYTRNNPLKFVDPTGLYDCVEDNEECLKRLEDFEKRRQALLRSRDSEVVRAAEAYGSPRDGNGVLLKFAAVDGDAETTYGIRGLEDGSYKPDILVTIDLNIGGTRLDAAIGHEGSHVADGAEFIDSINRTGRIFGDRAKNVSKYSTEMTAYRVTNSIIADANDTLGYGFCGQGACSLGRGLSSTQVTNTINSLLANPRNHRDGIGITRTNPGTLIYPLWIPPQ